MKLHQRVSVTALALFSTLPLAAAQGSGYQPFVEPIPALDLPTGIEVYFSPQDDIETVLLNALGAASVREVLFSQYALTNDRVLAALKAARARGVVVIGVLEPRPAIPNYTTPRKLAEAGIPILFTSGTGWNNNKFIVIDRSKVITGSFDWTRSAPGNFENVIVVSEAAVATRYYNAWVALARGCKTYGATFGDSPPQQPESYKARP